MQFAAVNSTDIKTNTYFIDTGSIKVSVFTEYILSVNLKKIQFLITWSKLLCGTDHTTLEISVCFTTFNILSTEGT